jgi:hypothetical protein
MHWKICHSLSMRRIYRERTRRLLPVVVVIMYYRRIIINNSCIQIIIILLQPTMIPNLVGITIIAMKTNGGIKNM